MFRCRLIFPLFLVLLLAGCGTVVTYRSNAPAGIAKPVGYPIPVYTEEMTVPRPFEVIGSVAVNNSGFTMTGGSAEAVTKAVMQCARQNGADAVQVTSLGKPGFENPNYRMTAELLRYTSEWETIAISEKEFRAYLDQHRQGLDPIEGVWFANSQYEDRIGIMRNVSKPGGNFVGFVLKGAPASWRRGYKKIDIARGKQPGMYDFNFYFDDFSAGTTTVVLNRDTGFTLTFQKNDGIDMVTYSKN